MTLEELQALLLAEQEKNTKLTEELETHKSTLSTKEEEYKKLVTDLTNARELNSKLALRVSEQTLTPKDTKEESKLETKTLSFDEIIKQL